MTQAHTRTRTHTTYFALIIILSSFPHGHVDAACNSRHFNRPTRAEFQAYAREALRSAKQRHRMATHVQRDRQQRARTERDFWKDSRDDDLENAVEEDDAESIISSHDEED